MSSAPWLIVYADDVGIVRSMASGPEAEDLTLSVPALLGAPAFCEIYVPGSMSPSRVLLRSSGGISRRNGDLESDHRVF